MHHQELPTSADVVVIGGTPAGVAAAIAAARADKTVIIIEQALASEECFLRAC